METALLRAARAASSQESYRRLAAEYPLRTCLHGSLLRHHELARGCLQEAIAACVGSGPGRLHAR